MATERLDVEIAGVDRVSPVLKSIESGVIRFVGAVSSALTLLSVIGFPVASAASFQQQLLEVKKTTDFTNDALNTLKTGLIELSKTTNVAVNELARIAALGGQMGVGGQGPAALIAFTEELSRAVTALDVSADQAAPALGKLVNIFNLPLGQFRNAVAVINQLSNVSTATAEEILDIQRRIGDLGGSVTFAQSAALSALAIDIGLTAETAGTSITKIFADMKSAAADFAAFMGTSTGEWIELVNTDGVAALDAYLTRLNSLPAEIAAKSKVELTGGGRIFELVTKLQNQLRIGDSSRMAVLIREANREWIEGTSAIREQQNVLSGTIAQWDIFRNKVNATFIAGGDEALKAINDTLRSVGDTVSSPQFVQGFASFIENLVNIGRAVVSAFSGLAVTDTLRQVDWGTLFDIAGLLALVGILKTIPLLLSAIRAVSGSISSSLQAANAANVTRPFDAAIRSLQSYVSVRRAAAAEEASINASRVANAASLAQTERTLLERQIALQQQKSQVTRTYAALEADVENRRTALMTARTAAIGRVSALEERYSQRSVALTAAREQAQNALTIALEKGNAAAIRAAQAQLASIGRQIGGTNSYFAQAIARERAAIQPALNGLVASYTSAVDRMRRYGATTRASESFLRGEIDQLRTDRDVLRNELNTVVATTETFKRSWYASFVGAIPAGPLRSTAAEVGVLNLAVSNLTASAARLAINMTNMYRTVGLVGMAAAAAARGITLLGTVVTLAGRGFGLLSSLVSRFFMAWIVFDIASLVADMLGWKDAIKDAADSFIEWVSRLTGFKLPTFGDAAAVTAETRLIEAQVKQRERLYAQAEAFSTRFGEVKISASLDELGFQESLANMEKSLAQFARRIEEGGTFGANQGITSSEAFVEGIKGVVAFETQIASLAEKLKEIRELQKQDEDTRLFDPGELARLEEAARTVGLTADQQERLGNIRRQQQDDTDRYLLRMQQIREVEQQRGATIEAQSQALRASLSLLDTSAADDWFGGDQLLRRLRDQKQIVDSLSDAVNRMRADMGPDLQTGQVTDDQRKSLLELQNRLNESTGTLQRLKGEFASTSTTISIAGAEARQFTDALVSGDISQFFTALGRDGAIATAGIAQYLRGYGNVVDTVEEQNRLASQLVFGREMAKGYGIWANSARVAAEQAKNAVAQAVAQNRRDLDALLTFFLEVDSKIKANADEAAALPGNRKIDDTTDRKLFELDLEKQKKQELIDIDEEAGRISYREAETRRFLLNKEFDERARKIRELADLQKAGNLETRLKTNFEEQAADARILKKEIDELTLKLSDPTLTDAQRDTLIAPLQSKTTELEAKLAQMKATISGIADIKPVGTSIVVTEEELRPLKEVLTQLTSSAGAAKVEGLAGTQRQLESLTNDLEAGRANAERLVNSAVDGLNRLATQSGITAEALAANIAAAFSSPAIQEAINAMRERVSSGLVDVAGIRFDPTKAEEDARAFAATWSAAMGNVPLVAPKLNVAQAIEGEAASVQKILEQMFTVGAKVNVTEVVVPDTTKADVSADPEVLTRSVEEGLRGKSFSVDVTANVQGSGVVAQRNRDGGHIRGAGTSRSDSILSWLSHGEYVMDALTVRMFGPGFFKFLQSIAKSGSSLGELVPGFKNGGAIGRLPSMAKRPAIASTSGLPAILAPVIEVMDSIKEEVFLDIAFNGKPKSRMRGSREEVRKFTDALMELKRSM